MTSTSGDRLTMRVEEAAARLGISRGFAYQLVNRGELPALRFGRRIVVPRSALEDLVASAGRAVPGTAPITNGKIEQPSANGSRSSPRRRSRTQTVDEGVGRLPLDGIEGRED